MASLISCTSFSCSCIFKLVPILFSVANLDNPSILSDMAEASSDQVQHSKASFPWATITCQCDWPYSVAIHAFGNKPSLLYINWALQLSYSGSSGENLMFYVQPLIGWSMFVGAAWKVEVLFMRHNWQL